jgi:hypothetical protein
MHLPTSTRIALSILLLTSAGLAQTQAAHRSSGDLAATFIGQRSLKADTSQNFWMEGGSAEVGFNIMHGLGFAADYTGTYTSSIGSSGVPLTLSVIAFGPRYRWHAKKKVSVYGETLFGYADGSDSTFPAASGSVSTASSFALQLNGAWTIASHLTSPSVRSMLDIFVRLYRTLPITYRTPFALEQGWFFISGYSW